MDIYIEIIKTQAGLIADLVKILHDQAEHLSRVDREIQEAETDLNGLAGLLNKMEVDFDRLE